MKLRLTVERLFSLILVLTSLVAIFALRGVPLTANYSVGPAMLPLAYAILLIASSVAAWLSSSDKKLLVLDMFNTPNAKRCILLIALLTGLTISMSFLGFWPPLYVFTVLSFWKVERHPLIKSVLMSAAWMAFIYVMFVVFLKVNTTVF